ncbi:ABC transporter permease [Teredinibacter sp. KSP-S5-2]|uniref:ABC transporter permease n=1 Tax=Teredinibacter sp. KSP-S5-2 TaxID=3034506 RepID=UPI0029342111|nr:FtsX-like permease family protein [Teredinibacter sp. KSP-S5-2]WNO08403.1 FtsX-like permease family protein [Teredinibacter sp. KSP-S5-2]
MKNTMLNSVLLLLWRDWKSGELNLLLTSLLLAVATIGSISLFTNRIQNSIEEEATQFLAADAQIKGSTPIPEAWQQQAAADGLTLANAQVFRAMAFANDKMQLSSVKAVDDGYPLKGKLRLADQPFTAGQPAARAPKPGHAWVVSRLMGALGVQVGDQIEIGEAEFVVSAVLIKEPDSSSAFFGVAPRIIIHSQDVAKTGAVSTGSRVSYTLMLKGDESDIAAFQNQITPQLGSHFRWVGIQDDNRGVGEALSRASSFLLVAGSLSILLLGIAIAMSARRYAARKANQVALLKTFGKTPNQILRMYMLNIFMLGCTGFVLGSALAWLLHMVILSLLGDLIPHGLQPPGVRAYWAGGFAGLVALLAFAAPPILPLRYVSPWRVLQAKSQEQYENKWLSLGVGTIAIAFILYWFANSVTLTAILLGGIVLSVLVVGVASRGLLTLTNRLSAVTQKAWRFGLANLYRHRQFNALQIVIFSLLFMIIFIMFIVRTSLVDQWRDQLPEGAPNHFIFNVFQEEKAALENFFKQKGIDSQPFYPMARGRVIAVNGSASKDLLKDYRGSMNYERELNLTWSDKFGGDNEIVAGKPWAGEDAEGKYWASVEKEYAEGLGIEVGDDILVSVAGDEFTAQVKSIRSVKWDSMNPNFFLIFNQPFVSEGAVNWLTSFYLPPDKKTLLNDISFTFPTMTFIEVDQMIDQVQSIIAKVSLAVEFVFVLVIAAGALVLVSSIQSTLDERLKESAILRALGANSRLVGQSLWIEFGALGLVAGVISVFLGEVGLYLLQTQIFKLDYLPSYRLWWVSPLLAALLIGAIGYLSTRRVVKVPPLVILANK